MTHHASTDAGRPHDDDVIPIERALRFQCDYVRSAGSAVAGLILEAIADDVVSDGALAGMLPEAVRFGDFPGLRVMAVVHRLALERRAPRVALRLPTLGGIAPRYRGERQTFRADVVDLLVEHPLELAAGLARTPQTNEPGRAALLRCALSRMDPLVPVRLREIGASAGLNLRADRLPGLPGLESGPFPRILDREGCDRDPVDLTTTEGRNLLSSYVWVDDVARFARLRKALVVAAEVPANVVRQDAADYCASLDLCEGTTTVLWHSAMWVYLDAATRSGMLSAIEVLGRRATQTATLAHVSWEWPVAAVDPLLPFSLVMRTWRGAKGDGAPHLLARGSSHGDTAQLADAGQKFLAQDPLIG